MRSIICRLGLVCFAILAAACAGAYLRPAWWTFPGDPYIRLERWDSAGGLGWACVISDGKLSVITISDFKQPTEVLYRRALSSDEYESVLSAVHSSKLLTMVGKDVAPPVEPGVVQLSDGPLSRISFQPPHPYVVNEASVWAGVFRGTPMQPVADAVNRLLPEKYQFDRPR